MSQRIWKRVNGELVGFGNGHRAIIYETQGLPGYEVAPVWTVLVYKGDKRVAKYVGSAEVEVKRYAEKNYLKEK